MKLQKKKAVKVTNEKLKITKEKNKQGTKDKLLKTQKINQAESKCPARYK